MDEQAWRVVRQLGDWELVIHVTPNYSLTTDFELTSPTGERYLGSIGTPEMVREVIDKPDEEAPFWMSDLIIVDQLSEEILVTAVSTLINRGEVESALDLAEGSVRVDGLAEVRTLHRLLFKRKFIDGPFDEFFGSPHIAKLQRRLFSELAADDPEQWLHWADIAQHPPVLDQVTAHLAESSWWRDADSEARKAFVLDCLAPLSAPDELIDQLVASS